MVGFIKKKVSSQTLSEKLKQIRQTAGVSLSEIAKTTKVRKIYLEKLEEGKFDELPPDVYVKGFLKSYANYLGIESEDVIRLYEKERGIQKNIKKLQLPTDSKRKIWTPSVTITPNMFAIALSLILIVVGVVYFYREIDRFSSTPRLVLMQPTGDINVESNTTEVAGLTDKDNRVFINGQPIYVNERGEFKETISLQQGINDLEIKSVNRFEKESVKIIKVSANYENQIAQAEGDEKVMGEQDEKLPEKITLEIKIEEHPTWVSVEVDGKSTQSGTMLPESIQIFEADEKIAVTSGKANKTLIKLNGEDLGILNDSPGVIRGVVFTKETKIIPEPTVTEEEETEEKKDKKKKG